MKNRATIKDVSRLAGVSTATVSRVINGTAAVSDEVGRRVQDAIERLSFRTNAIAMGLKSGRTGVIGLVVPKLQNIFFMGVMEALEEVVKKSDYSLLVATTGNDVACETSAISKLLAYQIDGLVAATSGTNAQYFERIHRQVCPVVLVDRRIDGAQIDMVSDENRFSSYKLAQEILSAGRRRLVILKGLMHLDMMRQRLAGVHQAINEAEASGIEVRELDLFNDLKTARHALAELLSNHSGQNLGVISLNGQMTEGVLLAARQLGLSAPQDFSLVSFGQLSSELIVPKVTCIPQDGRRIGERAGELLLMRLEKADHREPLEFQDIIFENLLFHGDST